MGLIRLALIQPHGNMNWAGGGQPCRQCRRGMERVINSGVIVTQREVRVPELAQFRGVCGVRREKREEA